MQLRELNSSLGAQIRALQQEANVKDSTHDSNQREIGELRLRIQEQKALNENLSRDTVREVATQAAKYEHHIKELQHKVKELERVKHELELDVQWYVDHQNDDYDDEYIGDYKADGAKAPEEAPNFGERGPHFSGIPSRKPKHRLRARRRRAPPVRRSQRRRAHSTKQLREDSWTLNGDRLGRRRKFPDERNLRH